MRFEMIMIIGSVVLLALLFYVSMKNPARNRLTKIIRFVLAVILLVIFFVYAVKEFGPRGNNPIFSDAGRGENTGEDIVQTSPGQELTSKGQEIIDIVITGFEVDIAGTVYSAEDDGIKAIEEILGTYNAGGYRFWVNGDYAVSSVFHQISEYLAWIGAEAEYIELN